MADTLERLLACQICFETFRETGKLVPRLLPCTHTLCESCVGQLLLEDTLTCPECRTKHPADNGVKSFPQNKYILMNIKRRSTKIVNDVDKCKEHGYELVLYCTDSDCQQAICLSCLTKQHIGHKVVDFEQGEKDVLLSKAESLRTDLKTKKYQISTVKTQIEKNNTSCVEKLKESKDELTQMISQRYEELIQNVADQARNINIQIEEDMAAINENLVLVDSITENTDKTALTREDISTRLGTLNDIETQVNIQLSEMSSYKYVEYQKNEVVTEDVKKLCGELIEREEHLESTELKDVAVEMTTEPEIEHRDTRQHASEYTCTVTEFIHTTKGTIYGLSVVDGNSAVVYRGGNELTQYKLRDGGESGSFQLNDQPTGIARVTLGNKSCLALSYRNKKKIEFRDVSSLHKVVHSYSVAPHQPWSMCSSTSTSSTLLYEDSSTNPSVVRWLDCSASPPKPAPATVQIQQHFLRDMTCVQSGDKELLITTSYMNKIDTYDTSTDKLEWRMEGSLPGIEKDINPNGITADKHGHLFVCDNSNKCIQMFSVADGRYMGVMMKQGQQALGEPQCVRWCDNTSSLVVTHAKKKYNHISVINVK